MIAQFKKQLKDFLNIPYQRVIVVVIFGLLLLYIAARIPKDWEVSHDFLRDIAIAFIVAAIVTAIYESHARRLFDQDTIAGVFAALFNDIVDKGVWKEIKIQIIEKAMIRKDAFITIELEKNASLPAGQILIKLKFEYRLCGLKANQQEIEITHFLDSFMSNKILKLPRFEQVIIGDDTCLEGDELEANIENGIFKKKVSLEGRDEKPIHVIITRSELAYLPGSYNLVMGELTDGVRLHLDKLPGNLSVEVNTNKSNVFQLEEDKIKPVLGLFLPGQVIEFRFKILPVE